MSGKSEVSPELLRYSQTMSAKSEVSLLAKHV